MSTFYEDNMNIKKINGFTLQQVSRDVWAIDEFGIDIMYLIIGTERALLIDTGIGIGNIRSVVETMTHLPYDVVNTHHHYDHVGGNGRFSMVYAHKKANDFIKEHNIDISSHEPKTYRFKIFGVTIFKIRQIGKRKQYALFNIIKIGKL